MAEIQRVVKKTILQLNFYEILKICVQCALKRTRDREITDLWFWLWGLGSLNTQWRHVSKRVGQK